MNLDLERQFFDSFEAAHGEYDVLAESSYRRILHALKRASGLPRGAACIDLGCGTGAFTRRLSAEGFTARGVDISPKSIERATALGGGTFSVADICATGLPPASFDCAVMSGVLHHIPAHEHRLRALREARRLLKPGGHFFSYDPNAHSPSMWLYRDPRSPLYSSAGKTDNEVLLTSGQIRQELSAAGFRDVAVRGLSGIAYRYVEGALARRLLPLYNHLYEPLIRWSGVERLLGTFLVAVAVNPEVP